MLVWKKMYVPALHESFDSSVALHCSAEVLSSSSVVKPSGHLKQVLEPVDGWYWPAGHLLHVCAPVAAWKRPAVVEAWPDRCR